jgi:hypothetical protein
LLSSFSGNGRKQDLIAWVRARLVWALRVFLRGWCCTLYILAFHGLSVDFGE